MEDDNAKDDTQPSKNEIQRMNSDQDLYNERGKYEERRDGMSNSESFTSASYSGRSRIDMAGVRPEIAKVPNGKRETKPPEKKRRARRAGRVEKRRRSPTRRMAGRRAPKRRIRKEPRALSVSTIFTRLSSRSGSHTPGCKFCGHRCCRRRFEYEVRRDVMRSCRKRIKKVAKRRVKMPQRLEGSKGVQVGSRTMMLSPLFLSTNAAPPEETFEQPIQCCEVTPEMIYEALRRLTMWRQYVQMAAILDYIKGNYPVNRDDDDLTHELMHKLRVATIVGIVTQVAEGYWSLNCALQNKKLSKSHVTKFWQIYLDTMKPIRKSPENKIHPQKPASDIQSDIDICKTIYPFASSSYL